MLTTDALVVMARKETDRIVEEGRNAARQRADEADAYAMQVLDDLAAKLAVITKQVDNGLQMMRNKRQSGKGDAERSASEQKT